MSVTTNSGFSFAAPLVLRWMLKAFLTGLFLGAAAALNALLNR